MKESHQWQETLTFLGPEQLKQELFGPGRLREELWDWSSFSSGWGYDRKLWGSIGWSFFGSHGMNLNTIMGGTFLAHMTGSFPTSAVMRQSSETIAGSGQQQKPSGLNKKLWDRGSSERVTCWVNSMVPLIRFCLTSAGSGAETFLESFRVISEAALTLSLGPRWLINWVSMWVAGTCGTGLTGALGSSSWLHFLKYDWMVKYLTN